MADQIRVNGNLQSWGSIVLKVDGEPFTGFDSISYGDKLEMVKGYGMGRHHAPRGRTAGKYSVDPTKIRGYKSSWHAVREYLASRSRDGKSYGTVPFLVVVQFVEEGEVPMVVEIEGCKIAVQSTSHEEGPDPLKEEVELDSMLIRRNGKTLYDQTRGAP